MVEEQVLVQVTDQIDLLELRLDKMEKSFQKLETNVRYRLLV